MNRLNELEAKLAAETAELRPSPALENALLKEFDAHRRKPHRPWWLLAAAACVAVAFWLLPRPAPVKSHESRIVRAVQPAALAPVPVRAVPARKRKPVKRREPELEFIPIPYTTPLAPWERSEIVRTELPVSALAAAGFHVETADTSAKAQADLLIGEDGIARGLRLISISSN